MMPTDMIELPVDRFLPSDLSLCVLRRLRGTDLVAACQASATWATLVRADGVWRRACVWRWPHVFDERQHAALDAEADAAEAPL